MAALNARLTGKVLLTKKEKFGSGDREFKFTSAKIQTGIATIEEVRFTDQWTEAHDLPRAGDLLDIEVEVGGFSGRSGLQLNLTAVGPYDESFVLGLHISSDSVAA